MPHMKSIIANAQFFCEPLKRETLAVETNKNISACIGRLFFSRGPSAIFFAVPFIVINSIKRRLIRLCSHFIEKYKKIIPSRIVGDSPSPVSMVFNMSFVVAPIAHPNPRYIGRSMYFTDRLRRFFSVSTTASFTLTAAKRCAKNFTLVATFTLANIFHNFFLIGSKQNRPPSDFLTSEVYV